MEMAMYKGRKITLMPGQKDDGTWTCQFTILEIGKEGMGSKRGYPDGSFATQQQAEAAALAKAKEFIDSNS